MPQQNVNIPLEPLITIMMIAKENNIAVQDLIDGIMALGILYFTYDSTDKDNILKMIKQIRAKKEA